MARLQILQLPEGAGDERAPFVLVVDQMEPQRYILGAGMQEQPSQWDVVAKQIGARGSIVVPDTIDIPANEVPPLSLLSAEADDEPDVDYTEMIETVDRVLGINSGRGKPDVAGWLLTACRELEKSEAARLHLNRERDELHAEIGLAQGQLHSAALSAVRGKHATIRELIERAEQAEGERTDARVWARHGYEIGQRHCSWTDHGVAPEWLTEGWPYSFDSCEHLKQAAEYDEALTRVRAEVARIRTITPTWDPVADLIEAALNGTPDARQSAGRPTHPDGSPYNYSEITAGGWHHCDGCRTWGQWTTEKPHDCINSQAMSAAPDADVTVKP